LEPEIARHALDLADVIVCESGAPAELSLGQLSITPQSTNRLAERAAKEHVALSLGGARRGVSGSGLLRGHLVLADPRPAR